MFVMPNGKVLGRIEVQADFRLAARAFDLPEDRIGTHSCRVSCATWLYQAEFSLGYIKRHGRWSANVAHVYLWEGTGHHGMVKRMSEVKFELHAQMT